MPKRTLALMILAASLAAGPAEASLPPEPPAFTLEVALTRAVRHNPTIQMAEARLEQAKLEKESQDLWWARTIRANANYNMLGQQGGLQAVTPDGTILPTAAIGVGVNLGELLAAPKQSARAGQAIVIAEAELKRTTLEVANQVTAAYQAYQAAKLVVGFSDEAIEATETDAKIAERTFARGGSQANSLVGARLAVHRVRADVMQSTGNVATSWANLITLIGDPALSLVPKQQQLLQQQNVDRR